MATVTVFDAADDSPAQIGVNFDRHGACITLPDGQIIVLDYSSQVFSLYHYDAGDDNEALLGRFSNGYAALAPKG